MVKRVLALITALCLVFGMIPAVFAEETESPASGTCGENLTWSFASDTGVITISGTGPMTDYSHTSTADIPWYPYMSGITAVVVEEGVTSIGQAAFYQCSILSELTLPSTLTSIGKYAFSHCDIRTLKLPDGLLTLGGFNGNPIEGHLQIPDSVTTILDDAFMECSNISSIALPDNLETCGSNAFRNCSMLSKVNAHAMPNLRYFNNNVFSGCAIRDLSWYTHSEISYQMFSGNAFEELEIPDCVTTVADFAFENCAFLTKATIPASVTSLGAVAFGGCDALESVYFLGDAPQLGVDLFQRLTDITCYYPADNETWTAEARNTYDGIVTWVAYDPETGDVDPDQPTDPSEPTPDYIHSGVYNGNINWSYNANSGLLSLSGAGEMPEPDDFYPWDDYKYDYSHVDIGEDMTHIGVRCFSSSSMLSNITIPGNVQHIGVAAFSYSSVRNVVIEEGVKTIGDSAFYNSGVKSITLPSTLSQMELVSTFEGCEELTSVVIPEGIEILTQTFTNCGSLTEVTLPDSLWCISVSTFEGCSMLTGLELPEGLETIDDYAFADTASLTELTIPSTVTFIGDEAFGSIDWYDGEEFHQGITTIHFTGDAPTFSEYSFAGYQGEDLVTCYYPAGNDTWTDEVLQQYGGNVTWIAEGEEPEPSQPTEPAPTEPEPTEPEPTEPAEIIASGQCGDNAYWTMYSNGLFTISGNGPTWDYINSSNAPWNEHKPNILHAVVEDGITSIGQRVFGDNPAMESVTLPDSLNMLGEGCFLSCTSLRSITIPEGVTEIPEWAFKDSGLAEIVIPETVTTIGNGAFSGCTNLKSVPLPSSLTYIDYEAFMGSGLTEVVIPSGMTSLSARAFMECKSLSSVTLHDKITTIHQGCFMGCTNLKTINLPKSLEVIQDNVFQNSGLTEITIPDSVCYIQSSAFENCTELTSVSLPDTLYSIAYQAFKGCTSLTHITIPASVTTLPEYTFQDCSALESIDLPETLSSIRRECFSGCSSLTSFEIPEGMTELDIMVFAGCTALESVLIPDTVTTIDGTAFTNCPNLIIYCYNLSFAHLYATAYEIPVVVLEENPSTPVYNINVTCNTGCSAVINPEPSPANRYVLLEIQLLDGYTLDSIRYRCADDPLREIPFEQISDTIFTFFMPASDISLEIYCIGSDNPFTDVKEGAFYYEPVLWAVSYGVTSGISETRFAPNDSCTRAQVVTFLWRAAGEPEPTSTKNPFTDVKSSAYYYKAVLWAVENGITTGMSATSFGPNSPCTRAQVVTFLYRAAGGSGPYYGYNPFQDVKSTDYYYNAVLWAVDYGITTGISSTHFGPGQTCTRGQVVTFLYRFLHG